MLTVDQMRRRMQEIEMASDLPLARRLEKNEKKMKRKAPTQNKRYTMSRQNQ